MKKGLVNILTPAYNSEQLIWRLLDSVLKQTYPFISMIVINDGSTDNTVNIVKSYSKRFESRGYSLDVYNQKNAGPANAINNGLKYIDGEFLVWPDSDDYYNSDEAIEKMVFRLSQYGDDVAVCRCAYNWVSENSMKVMKTQYPHFPAPPYGLNIFDEIVLGNANFGMEPGGWMIKTKFLDDLIPNREIYQSRLIGQNIQILFPYLFEKKCISIEEPLFTYLVRANSYSHGGEWKTSSYKHLQQKEESYKAYESVLSSIKRLDPERKKKLLTHARGIICKGCLDICLKAGDFKSYMSYYKELRNNGYSNNNLALNVRVKTMLARIPIVRNILSRYMRRNDK